MHGSPQDFIYGWEFASGPESVTFVKKFQNGYIIIICIPMYSLYKCLLIVTLPKLKPNFLSNESISR